MQKKNDLFVVTKVKDLAKYIITVTEKSPKQYRFTLVVRLQNYVLDVLEYLYKANSMMRGAERTEMQEKAKTSLQMLDYFAGLAMEVNAILPKQYKQISMQGAEALAYLNKWQISDKREINKVSTEEASEI